MPVSNINVKHLNRVNVYKALLREESIAKAELVSRTGVSLPTVTQNLNELIKRGLARETGTQASTGGRKAAVIAPVVDARIALGVDITQNHIGFAAVNLRGDVLAHIRMPEKYVHSAGYYQFAAAESKQFMRDHGLDKKPVLGTGVSVPGIVSQDGTQLLHSNVLGNTTPIALPLEEWRNVPSRLFNDAYAACLAENWDLNSARNFLFLSLSNSVGGAVVVDGEILNGNNQRSGEFGHMCLVPDGKPCYCGQAGHYDPYGSALALANHSNGRLEDFFSQLDQENPEFQTIFDEYLSHLALMICNLRMMSDYQVVLGGYVGGFLAPHLPRLRRKAAELDPFGNPGDYIQLCRHRVEASAVGAALYYISRFVNTIA